jgi:4-diphosphocytidyl-2-C-methyl-D-erythritol kinase
MRIRRQGPSLVVDTPAKLNLFLEVHGRRPDGYHEIETVMVSVGLYDTLRFTPVGEPALRLSVADAVAPAGMQPRVVAPAGMQSREVAPAGGRTRESIPTGSDNLVLRAAHLLRERCGIEHGAQIELLKRIPSQAGMGGGSSDAAATLCGLNRVWNLGLSSRDLHECAAALGSDVNFFLDSPRLAVCRGRGEAIEPCNLAGRIHFVAAQPERGLSTAEVFRRWTPAGAGNAPDALLEAARSGGALPELYNALQPPAESLYPELKALCDALSRAAGSQALMTGSGSVCFAVCRTQREAFRAAARLRQQCRIRAWQFHSSA